jgi:flagellar FliJ protein
MVKSKRLRPVQRVAKSKEQTAARELGDCRRMVQEQEQRLEELCRYHDEYLERFNSAARNGMSSTQLQEYRVFLNKLERAIKEQELIVLEKRSECSGHKEVWQQKRVRTEALGKVVSRYQKEERKENDVREQKESDDHGQRSKG